MSSATQAPRQCVHGRDSLAHGLEPRSGVGAGSARRRHVPYTNTKSMVGSMLRMIEL